MGSETSEKIQKRNRFVIRTKICVVAVAFCYCSYFLFHKTDSNSDQKTNTVEAKHASSNAGKITYPTKSQEIIKPPTAAATSKSPDLSNYKDCKVSFQSSSSSSNKKDTKPLWFSNYPTSLGKQSEKIQKQITNNLTGLSSGGKSFYASSKATKLRHCFDTVSTTVTCANIHPVVEMNDSKLNSDKFFEKYVMAIRNPMTVIPAFFNEKQIKYHGVKGQASEESWKKHRDEWLEGMLKDWIRVIQTWKRTKYDIGMYLVYEYLMDPVKGPEQIKNYATLLQEAGFDVAPSEDMPCIWYNSIGQDEILDYQKSDYDFYDYVPSYTNDHKEIFLRALKTMIDENSDDQELVDILAMYRNHIRDNIRLDD